MEIDSTNIPLSQVIAWAFVHSLWQGAIAFLIYLVGCRLLDSPAMRYRLGLACLLGFLVIQVCTFIFCSRWMAGAGVDLPLVITSDAGGHAMGQAAVPRTLNDFGKQMPISLPTPSWLLKMARAAFPFVFWVSVIWMVGCWLYAFRYLVATVLLRRELNRCIPIAEEASQNFRQLARRLHLDREVRFVHTRESSVPATCGWMHPVVLLPMEQKLAMTRPFLDAIVLHELAHIFRRDSLTHRLRHLVESVYFFHPLVRWMGAQMTNDSEKAADEIAADALGDHQTYARALVSLEEARVHALKLGANGGSLKDRILHIIASRHAANHASGRLSIAMILLCSMLLLMVSSEVIVRGASPDQRLLAWANERNLPEAVLQSLNIQTSADRASPAIQRTMIELTQTGTASRESLESVADAIHAGITTDRMIREWRGWIRTRHQDMAAHSFPVIGSSKDRIRIAMMLADTAKTSADPLRQAHLARAAYAMLVLEISIRDGVTAQQWILDPKNVALLHLDPAAERQIDFAVSVHNRRIGSFGSTLSGLGRMSPADLDEALTSMAFLPGAQLTFSERATPRDMEILRMFLADAPPDIVARWQLLHPHLADVRR